MLLTSSQVSAAISAGILIICTFALFISGVVLQKQSVKNLNAVLHPGGGRRGPWDKLVHRAEMELEAQDPASWKLDGVNDLLSRQVEEQEPVIEEPSAPTEPDWSRRAYMQMVQNVDEICNAITGVVSLSVQGSKPRRVLVYPTEWDDEGSKPSGPELQLIEMAKREHLLETRTTGQIAYNGEFLTDRLLNQDFDKILYLERDGLIINATRLDGLFDSRMTKETVSLGPAAENSAILLQPRLSKHQKYEDMFGSSMSEAMAGLVYTVESIKQSRSMNDAYSQGQLLGDVGYIHLQPASRSGPPDSNEELRKRGREKVEGFASGSGELVDLINERYASDRAAVCGSAATI